MDECLKIDVKRSTKWEKSTGRPVCWHMCVRAGVIPLRWRHLGDEASTAADQRMRLSTSQGWPAALIPGQSLGVRRRGERKRRFLVERLGGRWKGRYLGVGVGYTRQCEGQG